MQEKIYCENCGKFVTYTTKNIVDTYQREDGMYLTYNEWVDTCDICGNTDCISVNSSNHSITNGHRAYMKELLKRRDFKKFFKHFWHDLRRLKF
jgi:hypothetical protein